MDSKPIIYADESGYTGSDFMNPDEPVFVSVSTSLPPQICRNMLQDIFGAIKAKEYKYSDISRKPKNAPRIRELLGYVQDHSDNFVIHVCYKPFALVAIWCFYWICPFMATRGMDPHRDGFSRFLPHAIFFLMPHFSSEVYFRRLLRQFQELMRKRGKADALKLFSIASQRPGLLVREYEEILDLLVLSVKELGPYHLNNIAKLSMDVSYMSLLCSANVWKQRMNSSWTLIHDKSSHLARNADMWEFMTSSDFGSTSFLYPGGVVQFPFDVESTMFVDSCSSYSIQMCDLIAGSIRDRLLIDLGKSVGVEVNDALANFDVNRVLSGSISPDMVAANKFKEGSFRAGAGEYEYISARLSEFIGERRR